MIRFRWQADRYFSGSIGGEVWAINREQALSLAKIDMMAHPDNYGGNVNTGSIRLTHQKRENNKKWKVIPKS